MSRLGFLYQSDRKATNAPSGILPYWASQAFRSSTVSMKSELAAHSADLSMTTRGYISSWTVIALMSRPLPQKCRGTSVWVPYWLATLYWIQRIGAIMSSGVPSA